MIKYQKYQLLKVTEGSNQKIDKEEKDSPAYQYGKIFRMSKISMEIMNEIYAPIDTINRFINLTLQTMEENEQGREFLLESKLAIRKTVVLLKRLNNYAKKIEKEIRELSANGREG